MEGRVLVLVLCLFINFKFLGGKVDFVILCYIHVNLLLSTAAGPPFNINSCSLNDARSSVRGCCLEIRWHQYLAPMKSGGGVEENGGDWEDRKRLWSYPTLHSGEHPINNVERLEDRGVCRRL